MALSLLLCGNTETYNIINSQPPHPIILIHRWTNVSKPYLLILFLSFLANKIIYIMPMALVLLYPSLILQFSGCFYSVYQCILSLPCLSVLFVTPVLHLLVVFPTLARTAGLTTQHHGVVGVPVPEAVTVPHHTHYLTALHLCLNPKHHLEGDRHHRHGDEIFVYT